MMLCMYDVVCFANSTLEKENFGNFNVLREMQSFGTMYSNQHVGGVLRVH
jgi:hypothetical protein